jgi:hypothetical protein
LVNPTSDDVRWKQALNDAPAFLSEWGTQAEAHGWTAEDLFGLDESAPLARYDRMGLIWLLKGRKVVALSEDAATFDSALVFHRRGYEAHGRALMKLDSYIHLRNERGLT